MRSLPKNLFIILVLRYPKLNNASKIPVRNLTPYIVGTDSRNNVLVGTEKFCRVLLLRGLGLPLRDQKREQKGSGMDGRTDGRTDSPCILQDFVPSGSLWGRYPAYLTANIKKCQSRARVPMTISCLWATGCYVLSRFLYSIINMLPMRRVSAILHELYPICHSSSLEGSK